MSVENNLDRYKADIETLGLERVNTEQMGEVVRLFGKELFVEPDPSSKDKSRNYIEGDFKKLMDIKLGRLALRLGGRHLISHTLEAVGVNRDNGNSYFWLEVGFLGNPTVFIPKVPTMRNGAQGEIQNPLYTTSIIGGRIQAKDGRILNTEAEKVRKRSFDELPQLESLSKGEVTAIGNRAYVAGENRATAILEQLCARGEMNFDDMATWILSKYRSVIEEFRPKPALVSLYSSYKSKDTDHYVRLLLDMAYLWHASPVLDFKIVALTIVNRGLKKKGAR